MEKLLLPIPEAGETLGIKRTTVYSLIDAGELRTVKIGRRTLIPTSSLEEYVARLEGGVASADRLSNANFAVKPAVR